jgi:8-oxo-dGTP diphosphatase
VIAFGEQDPSVAYALRPSAYLLLRDTEGRIATTLSAYGHFLPGGGIDEGESPEQAVVREAREECGFIVGGLTLLCRAVQFVHSRKYNANYEKLCSFFTGKLMGMAQQTEPSHRLVWLHPEEAVQHLSHGSHVYAVQQFLECASTANEA